MHDRQGYRVAVCPLCGATLRVESRRNDTRWRFPIHRPPSRPPGDEENCDLSEELVPTRGRKE
jgi:hypothetical protein